MTVRGVLGEVWAVVTMRGGLGEVWAVVTVSSVLGDMWAVVTVRGVLGCLQRSGQLCTGTCPYLLDCFVFLFYILVEREDLFLMT